MKRLACLAMAVAAHAGIVSQSWHESKLTLELDDGMAEVEWITPEAFRVARSWGGPLPRAGNIAHYPVLAALESAGGNPRMRTRYLTLDLDPAGRNVRVRNGDTELAQLALERSATGVQVTLGSAERFFGLMGGATGTLNLRGEKLERKNGFLITSNGYGVLVRYPEQSRFDLEAGTIQAGGRAVDFAFYYGPTPKEILEQHQAVTGRTELKQDALAVLRPEQLPSEATRLPQKPIDGWPALAEVVRTLNQWSLSAVLYPAFDLAAADGAPAEVKQRAADLAAVLPVIYGPAGARGVDAAARRNLTPYFLTYLREARDRGYPLIRPLPLEFSRDAGMEKQADVFMLGDEFLVAPVVAPGTRRRIELPRGLWTDLRTNVEYRGNQAIDVDAPAGRVPMFTRNGSLFPIAAAGRMELHYFPSLGGEFFLWEPDQGDYSQLHAAPAGDFIRVEIETKIARTYEWVLHHTKSAREVSENSASYQRVDNQSQLRPGTWWHDGQQNDLHILLTADTNSDRIVNITF